MACAYCGPDISAYVPFGPIDGPTQGLFFSIDVAERGLFIMRTVCVRDILATWTLHHGVIMTQGHFGLGMI